MRSKEVSGWIRRHGQARNTNEKSLNQRTVNLRSAHNEYATNRATLNNESGPPTQDSSQETNNDSQEADCGHARTKHDGYSNDEFDTDERP